MVRHYGSMHRSVCGAPFGTLTQPLFPNDGEGVESIVPMHSRVILLYLVRTVK